MFIVSLEVKMTNKVSFEIKKYIKFQLLFTLSFLLMGFVFVYWDLPLNAYMGKGTSPALNIDKILISLIYINIISFFLSYFKNIIKLYFLQILFLFSILPMLILYSYTVECSVYGTYVFFVFISFLITLFSSGYKIKYKSIFVRNKKQIFRITSLVSLFLIFVVLLRYLYVNGISLINFNILKVYDSRYLLRTTMVGFVNYFDSWVYTTIIPFFIIHSIYTKKKNKALFLCFLQLVLYGFFSHKFILFTLIIILLLYYVTEKLIKNPYTVIYCFIFGNFICLFFYFFCQGYLKGINDIAVWLYHRAFYTPAQINYYYYDYYSVREFEYFSYSFLRHFVKAKDMLAPAFQIGEHYYNNPATSSNASYIGSGYMQGGFVVLEIYSFLIGRMLNFLGNLKKVSPKILIPFMTIPFLRLFISSDLPTTLLTGGLGIAFLLICLMPTEEPVNNKNKIDTKEAIN